MQKQSNNTNVQLTKQMSDIGRLPPQVTELERAVLGALLLESGSFSSVINILSKESFYQPKNQIIYGAISNLYANNDPIDVLTVAEKLKELGEINDAGGVMYLAELTDTVGSSLHLEFHALIVQQKAIARKIITATTLINNMAYEEDTDVNDLIQFADKEITDIMEGAYSQGSMKHVKTVLDEVQQDFRKRIERRAEGTPTGVTTGLKELDKVFGGGWQNSTLNVIASRPGMGKTAIMLHFAKSAARQGIPVCIYSMEMSDVSLANRLVIGEAYKSEHEQIAYDRFRLGYCNEEEWALFEAAKERLEDLPIYIDDNPIVTPMYIRTHSMIMKKRGQCGLVLIDYLQLTDMANENSKYRNREQEVSQATRQFKISSKQCDIPYVLLSQLNRNVEGRDTKKPMLADLRESGAIEQDADTVSFIWRPSYYKITEIEDYPHTENLGFVIVAKQREGASNMDVPFSHNDSLTKLFDYMGDMDPMDSYDYSESEPQQSTQNNGSGLKKGDDLPF